jgi:flagellar motor switch protein FliM
LVRFLRKSAGNTSKGQAAVAGEVIRKKLLAGHQAAADGGPGADRCWRLAFARAVRDMMQLPVDFVSLTNTRLSLTEVLELPPDRALILMLEGPEDGLGLLVLSPDLLSALVEVLTMGKCGQNAPEARKPTRTDAAMLSPLADLALANLESALEEDGDLIWTSGFRYASFIEEARPLGLMLEDVGYRCLSARLAIGQGTRGGQMILILPADGRGRSPRPRVQSVQEAVSKPAFSAALSARVDASSCLLEAVLARVSMTLAEVMTLSVDAVLPLASASLEKISVEALDGRRISEGKLGQHRGMRAVRISEGSTGSVPDVPLAQSPIVKLSGAPPGGANWPSGGPDTMADFPFGDFPATGTH